MKIISKTSVSFRAEDEHTLRVTHANRGDPYCEGIELDLDLPLDLPGEQYGGHLFLEDYEARELRDLLNRLYPERKA